MHKIHFAMARTNRQPTMEVILDIYFAWLEAPTFRGATAGRLTAEKMLPPK